MFGEQLGKSQSMQAGQAAAPRGIISNTACAPSDGITSAVTELIDASLRNSTLINRIEGNLGISVPETSCGPQDTSNSLRGVLRATTQRLRDANDTLERIDSHLIS